MLVPNTFVHAGGTCVLHFMCAHLACAQPEHSTTHSLACTALCSVYNDESHLLITGGQGRPTLGASERITSWVQRCPGCSCGCMAGHPHRGPTGKSHNDGIVITCLTEDCAASNRCHMLSGRHLPSIEQCPVHNCCACPAGQSSGCCFFDLLGWYCQAHPSSSLFGLP